MSWRCVVCGKKITEDHKPDACPLCGVVSDYIVADSEYERPSGTLSAAAVADYDRALALEVGATDIYNKAAERAKTEGNELTSLFFEALAKNEHGHQVAIKFQQRMRGPRSETGPDLESATRRRR